MGQTEGVSLSVAPEKRALRVTVERGSAGYISLVESLRLWLS